MSCALWIANLMTPIPVNSAIRHKVKTLGPKILVCLLFVHTNVCKRIDFHLPDFSILIPEFSGLRGT